MIQEKYVAQCLGHSMFFIKAAAAPIVSLQLERSRTYPPCLLFLTSRTDILMLGLSSRRHCDITTSLSPTEIQEVESSFPWTASSQDCPGSHLDPFILVQ